MCVLVGVYVSQCIYIYVYVLVSVCVEKGHLQKHCRAQSHLQCTSPVYAYLYITTSSLSLSLSLSISLSLFLILSLSLSHSGIHTHAVYFLSQYLSALSSPVTAGRFALCGIVLLASEPRAADTSIMFSLYAPWGRAWEGRIEGGLRERGLGSVTIHEKGQKEMH